VEVTPARRENEADEADREREASDDLSGAAAERGQSADEERETTDRPDRLTDLREADSGVSLDRDCECEHSSMITTAADGAEAQAAGA
jgi:hypothetical protein